MRTAIYTRVSTDKQTDQSQLAELRSYCDRRGWRDVAEYRDVVSGSKFTRDGLDRLMNDVRRGRLQMVICFKLDRLGRSLAHLAQIVAELSTHRVALVCTSQGIDTSDTNPAGRLQLGVLMAVAEFERELIRERVLAGIAAAKASGKRLGRKEKLSKRAPDVKALVQQGKGTREISRLLKMPVGSVCKVKAFLSRSRPDSDDKGKAQPTSHLQTTGLTVD